VTRAPESEWQGPYSRWYTLWVLTLVFGVAAFSTLDRTIVSILVERIKAEFALSDTELGLLMGPSFALVHAALVLPIARLADVSVRRNIVAICLFVWSLFTAGAYVAQSFVQLFLMRMGVGVGEAGGVPPSYSMLSDYLPPAHRARGLAVVPMGATLGLGLGMMVGGYVAEAYDWRTAFIVAGVPGMLLAALFRLTVREPARGASEPDKRSLERPPVLETARYLLASRTYRLILIAKIVLLFSSLGRSLWEPGFIIRIYEMGEARAATWYFLTSPLPSAFGVFLGGWLADRLGRRDRRWYLWVPALGEVIAIPFLIAFLLWPESHRVAGVPFAFVLSFIGSIAGSFFIAPFTAVVQGIARLRMRAFAIALMTLITTLVGMGAGPVLVGMLSDAMTSRFGEESIRYSLLFPTAVPVLSVFVCLLGAGTVARDLERSRLEEASDSATTSES